MKCLPIVAFAVKALSASVVFGQVCFETKRDQNGRPRQLFQSGDVGPARMRRRRDGHCPGTDTRRDDCGKTQA